MQIRRWITLLTALVCSGATVSAQFVINGDDPGRTRWSQVRTDAFRMVYPAGMDSLARTYLGLMEQYRPVVGTSVGMAPGQFQWGRTPVILHPFNPYPNGSVTWAPRRMDLYPVQEAYASDPTPWPLQLAVHESRHLAQMQFGYRKPLIIGHYIAGEMWHGLLDGLFVDMPVFEGDAVVAETALTASGRARTADFLNYYQVAFDAGDWRDWYKWRYGSFKRAAPDYYTTGFMTMAGMRVFYGQPLFSSDYFSSIVRRPLPYKNLQRAMTRASGASFDWTWRQIQENFHAIWTEEAAARAPFLAETPVTEESDFETNYEGLAVLDGVLYALKRGKVLARRLVRLEPVRPEDGTAPPQTGGGWSETDCGPFAGHTGDLVADPVRYRLYWSETVGDVRWELAGTSRIRWMDAAGARHDLTAESRYYNPAPSADGEKVAAVEYPYGGGSPLVVLDADDGAVLARFPAPSGVQLTEPAWLGDTLYALGIADGGFGLWRHSDAGWEAVLPPTIQKMRQLRAADGRLTYVSDRNGVNEWYAFDPVAGQAEQLTSTRYGGRDFVLANGRLLFTTQAPNGRMIRTAGQEDLRPQPVDPQQVHTWTVAERLSAQERWILAQARETGDGTSEAPDGKARGQAAATDGKAEGSAAGTDGAALPAPYRKALHLLHFHSWLPLYFNYDDVESMSFDMTYQTASLGATGFFQNDLGTASGFVGYSAHKDPYDDRHWRHSFHGKMTYSGLYPVFEAGWDLNDRAAIRYVRRQVFPSGEKSTVGFLSSSVPALSGSLRAYIPLTFNKNGILRGLVPQVRWTFSNDVYSTGLVRFDTSRPFGIARPDAFLGHDPGVNVPIQTVTASLRGYATLPTASSQVYPRLGFGAEAGAHFRPGLGKYFSPSAYGYLYGYLPGFRPEQGLRLTAIARQLLDPQAELPYISVVTYPRGFTLEEATPVLGDAAFQGKLTVDYAIPLYFGDISALSPFAYIRNFLLIPHADLSLFGGGAFRGAAGVDEATGADADVAGVSGSSASASGASETGASPRPLAGTLFSVGVDLSVKTGNILWLPFYGSIGLSFNVLGGNAFAATGADRIYVGSIFNVDF